MDYIELAIGIAAHIREAVRPRLGLAESRHISGTASSGDATFGIDSIAEDAVVDYIRQNDLHVAYYTEDTGLQAFGEPEATLVIDPIDGSRGAIAGFECCVVSVAVADYSPDPRMRDVRAGCVYEIKDDRAFVAMRGQGAKIIHNGAMIPIALSRTEDMDSAAWTTEIAGRPSATIARVLGKAIDASSVRGGFFVLNSTAFSLTRLVSGQLSAVADVGGRLLRDYPHTRPSFLSAGCGKVLGLFPYDIAAAALIAQEAGCVVTDAYGKPLDDIRLLDSTEKNLLSLLAASTPVLHRRFLDVIERGQAGLR